MLHVFQRFSAYKYHWSESKVPVVLSVNAASLDQIDQATGRTLCSYDYKDMEGVVTVCGQIVSIYNSLSHHPLVGSIPI